MTLVTESVSDEGYSGIYKMELGDEKHVFQLLVYLVHVTGPEKGDSPKEGRRPKVPVGTYPDST